MFFLSKFNKKTIKVGPILARTTNKYYFSTFNTNKDYFKILGIEKGASEAQIKSAYYKLALKFHPDHNKGQQAKFKQINEAYSVLSDNKIKQQYVNARNTGSQNYSNYNSSSGYSSYGNSGAGPTSNEWRRNWQGYQQPYRGFQQRTYEEYDFYERGRRKDQYANNNYYENPYQAYSKFRSGYQEAERARMKFRQKQYDEWQKSEQQFAKQVQKSMRNVARFSFAMGIFLFLLIVFPRPRPEYKQYPPAYQYTQLNGNPYMQRQVAPVYQSVSSIKYPY